MGLAVVASGRVRSGTHKTFTVRHAFQTVCLIGYNNDRDVMSGVLRNPEYWRLRAEEGRLTADTMTGEARRVMLEIAEGYERIAKEAAAGRSEAADD
jgi:hypothetical protein